jgi:ferredoxin
MEERSAGARTEADAGRVVTPSWRLSVDSGLCMGTGVCAGTAPRHFTLVDGVSTPLTEVVEPDDAVVDAAESCPMEAITVREAATKQIIAPATT